MLEIPESYLEDEVRDGFYIPSIAKRAWAAELSILHEINRICEKYDIRYFADWGSFLGAVRHQGFIPWDDDLDICMFRSDLNKFIEVSGSELPDGFEIHSFMNNDYSWKFIINVVNTERMCFTPDYLKSHYNFPYMATVDIFVIDNVYEDEDTEEDRREKVKFVLTVADAITEENYKSIKVNELLTEIEVRCNTKIKRSVPFIELKRQLYKVTQDVLSEYNNDSSEYVVQQIPWGIYHKSKFKREMLDGVVKLPFEDTYICVPKLYDRVLRNKYGNYWEIRIGVGGHGYPYYNVQKESLGLPEGADYIPHYKFDKSLIQVKNNRTIIGGLEARDDTINSIEVFKNSPDYSGEFDRETVVFLPFKGDYWDSMRPFYEEELAKENVDVYVVPLPYYYKDYNGTLKAEKQYDFEAYPDELPIYLIEQLNLAAMFPDRIYIQNPYDEYNMCMSVPIQYYCSNIRNYTKKLIYIPWFNISDFSKENYPSYYNMQYYCTVPGVVLADEIIVDSSIIKDRYVDKLVEFAGEDTRKIWEEKIVTNINRRSEERQEKKRLLFYASPSTILEYQKKYICKLNNSIETFKSNKESLSVTWQLSKADMNIILENSEELYKEVLSIKNSLSSCDGITVDEEVYDRKNIGYYNAYYGDPSYIAKDFIINKKPVMICNPDIV